MDVYPLDWVRVQRLVPRDSTPRYFVLNENVNSAHGRKVVQKIGHDHARAGHQALRQSIDSRGEVRPLSETVK
jgi:hypothetical protein